MKNFKVSIAAVVAVIAIGGTFAAKAGMLSAKMALVDDGCYASVDIATPGIPAPESTVPFKDYTPSGTVTNPGELLDPNEDCPAIYQRVCCFQVEDNHVIGVFYRNNS
jgi:hypothetical protein